MGTEGVPSSAGAAVHCEGRDRPVGGACSQPALQRVLIIQACENRPSNLKALNGMKIDESHTDSTPI